MRVYIAGPVAGYADNNRPAFQEAKAYLMDRGHVPISPLDVPMIEHPGRECPPGPAAGQDPDHSAACFMRADVLALLECDAIYLLEGWPYSLGARTEFEVARACGLELMFERKD